MTAQITTQTNSCIAKQGLSPLAQNLAALVFGIVILFVVGFAPLSVAHNAAHDARHTVAFPCH